MNCGLIQTLLERRRSDLPCPLPTYTESALGPAATLSEPRRGRSNAAVIRTDSSLALRVSFKDLILFILFLAKALAV